MKITLLICIVTAFTLNSCVKDAGDEYTNCHDLTNLQVTANTQVQVGGSTQFSVSEISGYNNYYTWTGPGNFSSSAATNSIDYAQLANEGWYYVHVTSADCNNQFDDSVYIDVLLNQGNPSCTTTTNFIEYNNLGLGDQSYTYVSKGISSSYGVFGLEAHNSGSDIGILFNPYWNNREPEDGIYDTNDTFTFDQFDGNYNKVFVYTVNQSILWQCHPGQQVYVSHVNGKLKVRYCDLEMGGYNGTSYITHATGDLTEQ